MKPHVKGINLKLPLNLYEYIYREKKWLVYDRDFYIRIIWTFEYAMKLFLKDSPWLSKKLYNSKDIGQFNLKKIPKKMIAKNE